jgi:hypothetical protein
MAGHTLKWDYDSVPNMSFRVYENGVLISANIENLHLSIDMTGKQMGSYQYQVEAFDETTGLPSAKTAPLVVKFNPPPAPVNLRFSYDG